MLCFQQIYFWKSFLIVILCPHWLYSVGPAYLLPSQFIELYNYSEQCRVESGELIIEMNYFSPGLSWLQILFLNDPQTEPLTGMGLAG